MLCVCLRHGAQACSLPGWRQCPSPTSAFLCSLVPASLGHIKEQLLMCTALHSLPGTFHSSHSPFPKTHLGGLTLSFYGSELEMEVGDIYQGLTTTSIGKGLKPSSFLLGCRPCGPHTALRLGRQPDLALPAHIADQGGSLCGGTSGPWSHQPGLHQLGGKSLPLLSPILPNL